jgi:hypothetical protein
MPEGNEAKILEGFFWLAAAALLVWPLTSAYTPPATWQDHADWIASCVVAASAGLFFTLRRTRPSKHPQKTGIAIVLVLVFLLFLQMSRWW